MTLLTDVEGPGSTSGYENSRHIRFLDVPDNYTTGDSNFVENTTYNLSY
jgi:hypothetical protein